jgi:hypothetical protein
MAKPANKKPKKFSNGILEGDADVAAGRRTIIFTTSHQLALVIYKAFSLSIIIMKIIL